MDVLPLAQTVLVTGGAGFIGRHLVERLHSEGNQVKVFDLPNTEIPRVWQDKVEIIYGDVASPTDVETIMHGVGTVFHTAAVVSDWAPNELYERVTIEGSRNIFKGAVRNGSHVILLSSCAVYGDRVGREVLTEDSTLGQPYGIYGEYKQRQEELAWEYHENHGMSLTVVRPSKVYGPGSKPWVHEVVRALQDRKPALIGRGTNNPGLVFIDNLVDILLLSASLPQAKGQIYNGYDGTTTTLSQYFTDIADIIGSAPPTRIPYWLAHILALACEPIWKMLRLDSRPLLTQGTLRMLTADLQISLEKVFQELDYQPRLSYDEGIQSIEGYLRNQIGL